MSALRIVIAEGADRDACFTLRRQVFMAEQGIAEPEEFEGDDDLYVHLLARIGAAPAGTARYRQKGGTGVIGRVCTARDFRGRGVAAALMTHAADLLAAAGARRLSLGAQTHAVPFYTRLGYRVVGGEYLDAGIPHRDMVRDLGSGS